MGRYRSSRVVAGAVVVISIRIIVRVIVRIIVVVAVVVAIVGAALTFLVSALAEDGDALQILAYVCA